jgi:hypothetical protein
LVSDLLEVKSCHRTTMLPLSAVALIQMTALVAATNMDSPTHTIRGDKLLAMKKPLRGSCLYVHPNKYYPFIYVEAVDSIYADSTFWVETMDNGNDLYGIGRWYSAPFSHDDVAKLESAGGLKAISTDGSTRLVDHDMVPGYYLIDKEDERARIFMISHLYKRELRAVPCIYRDVSTKIVGVLDLHRYLDGGDSNWEHLPDNVKTDVLKSCANRDRYHIRDNNVTERRRMRRCATDKRLNGTTKSEPHLQPIREDGPVARRSSTCPQQRRRPSLLHLAKSNELRERPWKG